MPIQRCLQEAFGPGVQFDRAVPDLSAGRGRAGRSLVAALLCSLALASAAACGTGARSAQAQLVPASAWAATSTTGAQAPAPAMAGDLIVKFRDQSEFGAAMAAVLGGQRTLASAAPLAARLATELGVPLLLVQVTSGREALLAIDRKVLLGNLAASAARQTGVARAEPVTAPTSGLPPAQASLRLSLQGGTAAASVASSLSVGGLVQPSVAEGPGGSVLLHYDLQALTQALLQRLGQRPEVEYAQANRLLRLAPPR